MIGPKHTKPRSSRNQGHSNRISKHWLDYVTLCVVVVGAIAAGFAARYTYNQWITAVDAEQRSLRAYISLRDVKFESLDKDTFDIVPEWENSGNSETVNMTSHLNRLLTDRSLPDYFNFGDIEGTATAQITLGPREISKISFVGIHRNCIDQFNRRDEVSNFYIWGWAEYFDVFRDTKDFPHIVRFCWDINRIVERDDGSVSRLSYGLCKKGNCADKDCPKPPEASFAMEFPNLKCRVARIPAALPEAPTILRRSKP